MILSPTPQEALRFGWSILPLDKWKKPLIKWKHLEKRQPTIKEISEWERLSRLTGWGLITGALSQRISLDFDGQGIALMRKWGLKPCRRTPRDGFHVDVAHPGFRVKTLNSKEATELQKRWPGLDLRGDGGYAMFSGKAIVKGSTPPRMGSYRWLRDPAQPPFPFDILPSELQKFLQGTGPEELKKKVERTNENHHEPADSELLVRTALGRILTGEHRNNMGFWLAAQLRDNRYSKAHALGVDFAERCPRTNAQGEDDPYTREEWQATVKSAYSRKARAPWGPPGTSTKTAEAGLLLTGDPVEGGDHDFIVNPVERGDGWFPRGDISLIAASSGTGKSTFLLDILEKQEQGVEVYGHTTNGWPYLVLMADRGERSLRRTLERMQIVKSHLPYALLEDDASLAVAVEREILKCPVMPAVICVEGIDLLADTREGREVSRELKLLQRLVHHYHIALIGSTGSPKQRVKDHYISFRDLVIGSTVWARKTETIVVMQREHGRETDEIVTAIVLARNNRPEQFHLVFDPNTGRLRSLTSEERAARETEKEGGAFLKWVLAQEGFTRAQARRAFSKMSGEMVEKRLEQLLQAKVILPDGKAGQSPRYVVPSIFEGEKAE